MTTRTHSEVTREELEAMVRKIGEDKGLNESQIEKSLADMRASFDVNDRIEAMGVKVSYRNHLLRMSNVTMRGGRLHDGTMHRQYQVTVSGNTFAIKGELKAKGFKWDGGEKLWYRPMTEGKSIHDHLEIARAELISIAG